MAHMPAKLNPLIDSILLGDLQSIDINGIYKYSYESQRYVDLVHFFQTLTEQVGADKEKLQMFKEFIQQSLVFLPNSEIGPQGLSGLGLFLPTRRVQLDQYLYLPVYSDLKLVDLFDMILPA